MSDSEQPVYIAVDAATADSIEFVTFDEDAITTWVEAGDSRFYEERFPVDDEYVTELMAE